MNNSSDYNGYSEEYPQEYPQEYSQEYPEYPTRGRLPQRNAYARSTYYEDLREQRRVRGEKQKAQKTAIVVCIMSLLFLNTLWLLVSTGIIDSAIKPQEEGQDIFLSDNETGLTVGDTQPTDPPEVINTAYGRVVPAEGDYATLIDQFILRERTMMKKDEVVLTFTGDCTLGTWPSSSNKTNYNAIYNAAGSPTYSFDHVKSLFMNDDYTYINLETTLTEAKKASEQTYAFKGSPSWAQDMIANSGVDGCNIANNHHYDWLEQGYTDTINNVLNAGMDVGDEDHIIVKNIEGLEIVLISGNIIWPTGRGAIIDGEKLTERLCEQVKQHKRQDNIVIVNAHWGLERQNFCNYEQYEPARDFIEAGADLVVGHHPHTLQGVEVYNGKYIFYSLGNFAFGGKASTDKVNRVSMMLRPRFALRDGTAIMTGLCVVPCYTTSAENLEINNYKPYPLNGEEAKELAQDLLDYSAGLKYGLKDPLDCPTSSL